MCGQWSEGGYVRRRIEELVADELPAAAYGDTIDEIAQFRPTIILCGGEVLLYPQLGEFLTLLGSHQLPFTLISNGTRLEGAAEGLVSAGLEHLTVSIDGPARIHDGIRGRAGAFGRALRGIRAVQAVTDPRSQLTISLNTTITREGWRSLPEVAELAEELAIDSVTFLHPNFLDEGLYASHKRVFEQKIGGLSSGWDGFVQDFEGFDAKGLAEVVEAVKSRPRTKTDLVFLPDFTTEEIIGYYRNGPFSSERFTGGCLGPWNTVNIHPNGDVSPCLGYVVGSLRSQSFSDIWRGETMASFRRIVGESAVLPACSRCCTYYRF